MDHETLQWIIATSSFQEKTLLASTKRNMEYESWFYDLSLDETWFYERRIINSLHGSRHLFRVGFFCGILALAKGQSLYDAKIACVAGLLHDIRRLNDKGDEGHAERSAKWLKANAQALFNTFKISYSTSARIKIFNAIYLHETPYANFDSKQCVIYKQHMIIVDILKTADALDRYRLPKLKWWLKDEYLVDIPPMEMKEFALNLIVMSERRYLSSLNSKESVMNSLKELYD